MFNPHDYQNCMFIACSSGVGSSKLHDVGYNVSAAVEILPERWRLHRDIYDKNDDKLNLKIEYRFYKDVKEGKYFYWNDLDENYPYSDLDNYYYDEVCKWNNKCEDNGVDLVIKKKVNKYKKINPVKYIKIITWNKEFDLNKFKVFSNSKEIKYTYDNSISLGIIEPSSEAILTLDNSYELESLNFKSINQVNYRIELTDKLELSYAPIIE